MTSGFHEVALPCVHRSSFSDHPDKCSCQKNHKLDKFCWGLRSFKNDETDSEIQKKKNEVLHQRQLVDPKFSKCGLKTLGVA